MQSEMEQMLYNEQNNPKSATTTDRISRGVVKALREIEIGKNIDKLLEMVSDNSKLLHLLEVIENSYRKTETIDKQLLQKMTDEIRALTKKEQQLEDVVVRGASAFYNTTKGSLGK